MANETKIIEIRIDLYKGLEDIAKLQKSIDGLTESQKNLTKGTNEYAKTTVALKEQRAQLGLLVKESANEVKTTIEKIGYIQKLEAQVSKLTLEYKRLSQAELEGSKGAGVLQNLKDKRAELASLEQAYGNYSKNVGNYSSATKMLGINLGQVMKEMPNFAISARIGIMSLTNNLPMLAESIQAVQLEQVALRKSQEGLTAAQIAALPNMGKIPSMFKMITASIFGLTGVMSILMVLMQIFGADIIKWVGSLIKGKEAVDNLTISQKELNKVFNDMNGAASKRIEDVKKMGIEIEVYGNKSENSKKIIDDFNKTFNTHYTTIEEIRLAYPKLASASMEAAIKIQAANSLITQSSQAALKGQGAKMNLDNYKKETVEPVEKAISDLLELAKKWGASQSDLDKLTTKIIEGKEKFSRADISEVFANTWEQGKMPEMDAVINTLNKKGNLYLASQVALYNKSIKQVELYKNNAEKMLKGVNLVDFAGTTPDGKPTKDTEEEKVKIDTNTFLTNLETAHQANIAKIKEQYKKGEIETETDFNTKLLAEDLSYYKTAETAISNFLLETKGLDEKQKADLLNKQADFHLKSVEQEIKFKNQIDKILLDNNPLKKEEKEFNERKAAAGLYGVEKEKMTKDQLAALAILEQQHADIVYDINMRAEQKELRRKEDAFEKSFSAKREANIKKVTDSENATSFNVGMGGLSKVDEFNQEMSLAQLRIDKINEEITARQKAGLDTIQLNKELATSEQDMTQIYVSEFSRRMQEAQQYGIAFGQAIGTLLTDTEDKGKALLQLSLQTGLQILAQYLTQLVASHAAKTAIEASATAASVGIKTADAVATAALDTTKAVSGSMASPQSIATGGIAGGAQAAILTGLIAAGLAASLVIVNSLFNTGKTAESNSAASKITKTTVTEKFHTAGIAGEKAYTPLERDEVTATLLKGERILSLNQSSIFDSMIGKMQSYGGSGRITSNVGTSQYLEEAMLERAFTRSLLNKQPDQLSITQFDNAKARQQQLKNNMIIR
ncbi:MAG: hypothetical protein ACOYOV_14305 [Bacteroidales bacterium]